jgi:succinate dehydrogenase / fumarate reductase, iron-sulfur subunit
MCGCCVSECNSMESDPDFLGPAALAKAQRFVGDQREGDDDRRARLKDLNGAHGIWDCTRCYFCNQRCPKGVDPRDAIAKLGAQSFRFGSGSEVGAKTNMFAPVGTIVEPGVAHAQVFVDSTRRGGFLDETQLVPKTIGPLAAVLDVPFALRLARAGKVPNPLRKHKAKNNDEVKRLWKLLEQQARGHEGLGTNHPSLIDSHD